MRVFKSSASVTCSTAGILKVVVPLILSSLSSNLMMVIDRLVLMKYSGNAMTAATMGGQFAAIVVFLLIGIAGTTEIFIGQNNGADRHDKIAKPVWQMIYFSLFSLVPLIPLGIFADKINLFSEELAKDGVPYQRILTWFCWIPALTATFAGFFVGLGETKIITLIVAIGSAVNIVLDVVFVFGHGGIIPSLGCKGAAIASVIAEGVQALILACSFWNKKNRKLYNTHINPGIDKDLFFSHIKMGAPSAIGKSIDLLAWYLVFSILGHVSKDFAKAYAIGVTMYMMFAFICEGITKGTAAISANFIGMGNLGAIGISLKKLVLIAFALCSFVMLPIVLFPGIFFDVLTRVNDNIAGLCPILRIVFAFQFVNITLEAIGSVPWGILLSGGDTVYPNVVNLGSLWAFVVLPVGILYYFGKLNSIYIMYSLAVVYNVVWAVLVFMRYKSLKWYKRLTGE